MTSISYRNQALGVYSTLDSMAFHHGKNSWRHCSYLNGGSNSGNVSGSDRCYSDGSACPNLTQVSHRKKKPQRRGDGSSMCLKLRICLNPEWILVRKTEVTIDFQDLLKHLLLSPSFWRSGQHWDAVLTDRGSSPLSLPHHQSPSLTQHDRIRLRVSLLPDISLAEPCCWQGTESSEDSHPLSKA